MENSPSPFYKVVVILSRKANEKSPVGAKVEVFYLKTINCRLFSQLICLYYMPPVLEKQ
jgi:hypothetical protein